MVLVLSSLNLSGQEVVGQWNGILSVPGMQLRLVFNISKTANGFASTMDSPDQGAYGIPVTTASFENNILKLEITNAKIVYEGTLDKNNIIVGNFKQSGQSFDLSLSKEMVQKKVIVRPQEPQKPYGYYTEEVTFKNKVSNNILAGTLSLPKKGGRFPVVILISGSGPQNRDGELLGHKPFLVLADYLTKHGIGVLRFDDRGVEKSTGDFKKATTFDFANDVQAGVEYLKTRREIDKKKIGLIGHSEGGVIAPIVARDSKDIDFIVLLAGTGIRGDKLMLLQKEIIERQMGVSENEIQNGQKIFKGAYDMIFKLYDEEFNLSGKINDYFKLQFSAKMNEQQINALAAQITSPWFLYFLQFDPANELEKVRCPVLAINGDKDLQVPADVNIEAIKKALAKGGNKKIITKILPNLNHLFQECKTGLPDEYGTIEQTFSPIALEEITKWILVQVK